MGIFDFIYNKKNLEYDTFPINILEMFGPIERHDFRFYSKKMTIFQQGNAKSFKFDKTEFKMLMKIGIPTDILLTISF